MEKTVAVTGIVQGRVQGVGFRYFALGKGQMLGLLGWVSNLSNGEVEYFVQGPEPEVSRFLDSLEEGPRMGRVERVTRSDVPSDPLLTGFEIRY